MVTASLSYVNVEADSSVVQYSGATLKVSTTLLTAVASTGYILITLPSEVSLYTTSSCTCTWVVPSSVTSTTCTKTTSSKTIKISGLSKALSADAFEIHIKNAIINPTTTTPTSSFTFATYTTSGTVIDSKSTEIYLTATVGTLTSASLTPTSKVVGDTTTLTVAFKPAHSITAGGIIKITFPKWNPNAGTSSQLEYFQGTVSCSAGTGVSSSLSCSFSSSTLTITGAASSAIAASTSCSITVSGFRNPISTALISGFTIYTYDSSGGSIDSAAVTIQLTTSATLTSASIAVDSSVDSDISGVVGESNKMKLTFSSPVPLNSGCQVSVTLPTQFDVTDMTQAQVSGLFAASQTTYTTSSSSNTLTKTTATNSFSLTSCSSYRSNTSPGYIWLDSLIIPPYTQVTDTFKITITDSSNNAVASITTGITFTPVAGTLTVPSLTPQTPKTVLSETSIQVSFTPSHDLDTTAIFKLTFPTQYSFSSTACTMSNRGSLINSASTCSRSGYTITFSNILSSAYTGGSSTALSFRFSSITLPSTTASLSGYTATTYLLNSTNSQYYSVDTYTGSISVSIDYGSMTAKVTPASYVAYATTSYTFTMIPENDIPQNGYIVIIYPTDVSIPDYSYSQSQISASDTFPTTPSCTITTSSRKITINNGFRSSSNLFEGGSTLTITIPGIQNPKSTTTSGVFKFYTYTTDGDLMDSIQDSSDCTSSTLCATTVTMTSTAGISKVTLTLGSYISGATTNYTFAITPTIAVLSTYYVIIEFPSEITFPDSQTEFDCSSSDTSYISKVACAFYTKQSDKKLKATLTFRSSSVTQINSLQTFRITVNAITSPSTTKPSSAFNIYITDKSYNKLNTYTTLTVTTNTAYTIGKASITQNTTGPNQYAKYTIVIYPEHEIEAGGGVYIIYPSQVTVPYSDNVAVTISSMYTTDEPTVEIDTSARQIYVTNALQDAFIIYDSTDGVTASYYYFTITLTGFKNPLYKDSQGAFIVRTVTSAGYYIDQVEDLILNSPCDYPCKTCQTNLSSNCTSCFAAGTLNKLQGTTCVSTCSTGKYYNSTTGTCDDCKYPCLACSGKSTTCTQCGLGTYLYLYNSTCREDCPSGYFADSTSNQCQKCTNNCKTCQYTTTTCTSCTTSGSFPYLYQQSCLSSCPSLISIPSISTGTCDSCDTSCKTCSNVVTNCTSCLSHMKYDSVKHTCTAVCEAGTQIYMSATGTCAYCNSNCKTCAGNLTTCTSCDTSLVLNMDNTCKSTCNATDQVAISNVCKQCELPCATCKNSTTHCTKCQGDYYLYNTTCVQYCPDKYEANNDTMQCILVGLICPTGFTVNEAGDGCIPNYFECPSGQEINDQRTACVPSPGSPVPFPFLFLSLCLCILVIGSFIKDRFFTKVKTNLIALIGTQEMLIYALMLCYSGYMENWGPFVLSFIAILTLTTSNVYFYVVYKKDIQKDQTFNRWCKLFPKTQKYLTICALVLNFKFLKMSYSGFYGLESCIAQFDDPIKSFFKPMRTVTYFSFIFVYIPILVADILIFASTKWGYQLFVLAIESFLITIFMIAMTIWEFRNPEKLLMTGDEQYISIKPRNYDGQTNVMSGIVDMDESTLIRSKVVDEDYEVNLRKKALVSILNQVGKNFFTAQEKGIDLGGELDKCMTKFDEEQLKLRRAFSLEEIKEEESWLADQEDSDKELNESEDEDRYRQRRYSYPLSPNQKMEIADPQFRAQIQEIKNANQDFLGNNVYAECKAPDKNKDPNKKKKQVSRRTQTYLRELLQLEGEDLGDSELEIILEDEAEIDENYAQGLIDNVIDGVSESESNAGIGGKRRRGKKKKGLNTKRQKEIPDFELTDIMGDFEIDDLGNFIILRGEKGELLDKRERRVNRRGYLIDRFGNVINKLGQVIFKAVELDSDDEIPAPFGFEKRKKNLLNLGEDGEFRVDGNGKPIADDEDLIDRELKQMRKKGRKKKKQLQDGQIVEEEGDDDIESSIDSLMAESPGKYNLGEGGNDDEIIDKITRKKVPKKRPPGHQKSTKKTNKKYENEDQDSSRKKNAQLQNLPPKRIKREDTREMFPSLAIESIEQKKLFKIAESIGGMANQIVDQSRISDNASLSNQNVINQDRLERLKQEHFKDILNESQVKNKQNESKLPPRNPLEKVYGNLNDVVSYEERKIQEQMRNLGPRAQSPFSSQMTSRLGLHQQRDSSVGGGNRRMRGLESIYLQKFDKKSVQQNLKKKEKAKFRNTLNQFVDDPELLADGDIDIHRQNEMSLMVADKLDRMQRQYMSSTATNKFKFTELPVTSMGFQNVPISNDYSALKKPGSQGSMLNQDLGSLEPVKAGNWIQRE